jgi:hypothetical protein
MTFQAYLDTIKAKTGMDPADFKAIAEQKGLLNAKTAQILAWLKADYDLGPGHGMAIVSTFKEQPKSADRLENIFAGAKEHWRPSYEALLKKLPETSTDATDTYISLLHGKSKYAIVAFTKDRMDVGIKLKGEPATERFEPSGNWNAMVTHRVRLNDPSGIDAELIAWLTKAWDASR